MSHKARECMHCHGVMVHTSTSTINFLVSTETFTCSECRKKVSIDGYIAFGFFALAGLMMYSFFGSPINILGALFFWGIAGRSAYLHRKNPLIGNVEAEITRVLRR